MRTSTYLLLALCFCMYACKPKLNRWTLGPFREHFQGHVQSAHDSIIFSEKYSGADTFYTYTRFDTVIKGFLADGATVAFLEDRLKPNSEFNDYGRFELHNALVANNSTSQANLKDYGRVIDYFVKSSGKNPFNTYLGLTITYDDNFNFANAKVYDSVGTVVKKYVFVYSKEENMMENTIYDSKGLLIEKRTYSYDNRRNETGYNVYNGKGSLVNKVVFRYENFDSTGNWRRKLVYKNDKLYSTTYRGLTYF